MGNKMNNYNFTIGDTQEPEFDLNSLQFPPVLKADTPKVATKEEEATPEMLTSEYLDANITFTIE